MKKLSIIITTLIIAFAACFTSACMIHDTPKTESGRGKMKGIPYVSDFNFAYYAADGKTQISFNDSHPHDAEILVRVSFTLTSEAFEKGHEKLTVRFLPTEGYASRVTLANTSDTSDDKLTASFRADEKDKKCSFEAKISFTYHGGYMLLGYMYDDDAGSNAVIDGSIVTHGFEIVTDKTYMIMQFPLNSSEPLNFTYVEAADCYSASAYSNKNEWIKNLSLPAEFNGKPVKGIAQHGFSGVNTLTEITVSDTVTTVAKSAFQNCASLAVVTLPSTVTSIGENAFDGCGDLKTVNFGGTKDRWLSVSAAVGRETSDGKTTVRCSDGDLTFEFGIAE